MADTAPIGSVKVSKARVDLIGRRGRDGRWHCENATKDNRYQPNIAPQTHLSRLKWVVARAYRHHSFEFEPAPGPPEPKRHVPTEDGKVVPDAFEPPKQQPRPAVNAGAKANG